MFLGVSVKVVSQLPASNHERLSRIRRRHSRSIYVLVAIYGATGLLIARFLGRSSREVLLSGVIGLGILVACGIAVVIRRTTNHCRELGAVCPKCGKILYEPKAGRLLDAGMCPHCREHVMPAKPGV